MNSPTPVRSELMQKHTELSERLSRIRRDRLHTDQPLDPNFSEQAIQQENDEVLDRMQATTDASLQQLTHALARLDAGAYGVCEHCGKKIETARLSALLEATSCSSCAMASRLAA